MAKPLSWLEEMQTAKRSWKFDSFMPRILSTYRTIVGGLFSKQIPNVCRAHKSTLKLELKVLVRM